MPLLFWIGSPFFSEALESCGWTVRAHNFEHEAVYGWQDIVKLAGQEPDAVVVADKSRPPFVLGQEAFPCPTVLYAVDTHIHSWLPLYAQSFDLCLVSLRDHLPRFQGQRLIPEHIRWSPPFARSAFGPKEAPRVWPCLFVGNVNPATTPKRARFLEALGRKVPGLHVTTGSYPDLFPQAEVVLNVSERGDMNFRIFEALGCGTCLVTPRIRHGLESLFTDGVDVALYPELDADAASRVILDLLDNPRLRASLAQSGLEKIDAGHRDVHRAKALTEALEALPENTVAARKAEARRIRSVWLRPVYLHLAETLRSPNLRQAYLQAATLDKKKKA